MKKFFLFSGLLVLFCLMFSCSKSTPTTPTPTPTPTPVVPTVSSITVTSSGTQIVVGQNMQFTATATMSNGTTRAGVGTWGSDATAQATVNAASGLVTGVSAGLAHIYFNDTSNIAANTQGSKDTMNVQGPKDTSVVQGSKLIEVRVLWSAKGAGDNVFDMPKTVTRVKITGTYTGYSSNFIVHIGGNYVVNELLGTGWGQTYFSGTYATTGGTVEILYSSGVAWTFTEVAPANVLSQMDSVRRWPTPRTGNREYEIYKREAAARR